MKGIEGEGATWEKNIPGTGNRKRNGREAGACARFGQGAERTKWRQTSAQARSVVGAESRLLAWRSH